MARPRKSVVENLFDPGVQGTLAGGRCAGCGFAHRAEPGRPGRACASGFYGGYVVIGLDQPGHRAGWRRTIPAAWKFPDCGARFVFSRPPERGHLRCCSR